MKKWALGIVACLAMALALVPGAAFAEDGIVGVGTADELTTNIAAGKSVILTDDITITDHLEVDGTTLSIDLNGHILKYDGDALAKDGGILLLMNGANVTLRDSEPKTVHKYNSSTEVWKLDEDNGDRIVLGGAMVAGYSTYNGGAVYVRGASTFTMEAGNIVGCRAYSTSQIPRGGAVYIASGGTFVMNGGSICGCDAIRDGGAVHVGGAGASFTMNGGSIVRCFSHGGTGGGAVCVSHDTTFNMKGGVISDCHGYENDVYSDKGVRVNSGCYFSMTGGWINGKSATDMTESETAALGVVYGASIVTFSGVDADQQVLSGIAPTLPDTVSTWYTNEARTAVYDGSGITAGTTLYAGGPSVSISYSDDALAGLAPGASYTVAWHDEAGTYSLELTADEDGEIPVSGNDYDLYGKYIQVSDSTGTRYLSIPNQPEAEDLTDSDVTATTTSLTVAAKPGYLYSIDGGENCYMDDDGDGKVVFEGLDSYADYTVSYRIAYTNSSFASPVKTHAAKTLCAHDYTKATCVAKATCKICGETTGELDPENHTDLQHYDAKEATAEDWGNVEFWYCFGCQKYFKGAEATPDEEVDKSEVWIPKKTDGDSKKGEETPDKPKKDGKEIPQTGDSVSAFALVGLAGVSALAVAFATKRH